MSATWKSERPKAGGLRINWIELVLGILIVFLVVYLMAWRLTVIAMLVLLALLGLLYPRHRSRRALWVASILLALAVLIPFDVYVRSFHGPLYGSKHSGPRLVVAVSGLPRIQECLAEYGEFIACGCMARINETQWMLVWD